MNYREILCCQVLVHLITCFYDNPECGHIRWYIVIATKFVASLLRCVLGHRALSLYFFTELAQAMVDRKSLRL